MNEIQHGILERYQLASIAVLAGTVAEFEAVSVLGMDDKELLEHQTLTVNFKNLLMQVRDAYKRAYGRDPELVN